MRGFLVSIYIFFVVMSLAAIAGGAWLVIKYVQLSTHGVAIQAKIIGFNMDEATSTERFDETNPQRENYYAPIVEYVFQNQLYIAELQSYSSDSDLPMDDSISIICNTQNPASVIAADDMTQTLASGIVSMSLGIIILVILVIVFKKRKKIASVIEST